MNKISEIIFQDEQIISFQDSISFQIKESTLEFLGNVQDSIIKLKKEDIIRWGNSPESSDYFIKVRGNYGDMPYLIEISAHIRSISNMCKISVVYEMETDLYRLSKAVEKDFLEKCK